VNKKQAGVIATTFGVVFIMALLGLAIFFPEPSPFQYTVFRVVLALASAGVATAIPGLLDVRIGEIATASGAIGIFLIVYFATPAELAVAEKPTDRVPGQPSSKAAVGTPRPPDSLNVFIGAEAVAFYALSENAEPAVYRVPFATAIYPDSIWVRFVQFGIRCRAFRDRKTAELPLPPKFYEPKNTDLLTSIQVSSFDFERDKNPEFVFVLQYNTWLDIAVVKYHGTGSVEGFSRDENWGLVGEMQGQSQIEFTHEGMWLPTGSQGAGTLWVMAGGRMIDPHADVAGPQRARDGVVKLKQV